MLKSFKYIKANGDTSYRTVYPINLSGTDKLLCLDLTEFDAEETKEYETLIEQLNANYIQAIKDIGLGSTFRTFFIERMKTND